MNVLGNESLLQSTALSEAIILTNIHTHTHALHNYGCSVLEAFHQLHGDTAIYSFPPPPLHLPSAQSFPLLYHKTETPNNSKAEKKGEISSVMWNSSEVKHALLERFWVVRELEKFLFIELFRLSVRMSGSARNLERLIRRSNYSRTGFRCQVDFDCSTKWGKVWIDG